MKHNSVYILFFFLFLSFKCFSQNFDNLIIGDWKVYKMEFNGSQLNNQGERLNVDTADGWIFANNHVVLNKYLLPRGDKISKGKYTIKDSVLILFNTHKVNILKLNDRELIFEDDYTWFCLKTELYNSLSEIERTELIRYTYYDSLKLSMIKLRKEMDTRLNETKDVYTEVTVMPSYPNREKGLDVFIKKYYNGIFLTSNEVSPAGIDYKYIQFIVEADGSISFPAINVNNIEEYDFFISVFKKMDKWKPGNINGKNVAVGVEILFRGNKKDFHNK